jgi:hypothetical protein
MSQADTDRCMISNTMPVLLDISQCNRQWSHSIRLSETSAQQQGAQSATCMVRRARRMVRRCMVPSHMHGVQVQ